MDPQAVLVAVEQACQQFKNPATQQAAEQVLLQFQQSQRPLAACQHILEHSSSLDARFQAACTMRVSIVREWASMTPEERVGVRNYMLQWVLHSAADAAMGIVRAALVSALAVVLKRGWLDMTYEERTAFFQELQSAVHAAGGSGPVQRTYFEVLEAVVSEFSLATASALGLAWEVHERCRLELEAQFLQSFFQNAVAFGQAAVHSGAALHGDGAGSTAAALSVQTAVLCWDFKGAGRLDNAAAMAAGRRGLSDSMQVQPGPAWSKLLLVPSTTDWLLQLLPSLDSQGVGGPLHERARQVIVALCSLAGDVFPRPSVGAVAAPETLAHIQQMLRAVLPWIHPADAALEQAANSDEGQVVDACRALSVLCTNHKPAVLAEAASALAGAGLPHMFGVMEGLTIGLLRAGGGNASSAPEPWLYDCCEMMLEAWDGLLAPHCAGGQAVRLAVGGTAEVAERAFGALVEAALKAAAEGAHEDEDEDDAQGAAASQDTWMTRAAQLGRAAPVATFARLTELLGSLHHALAEAASSGADPSAILEQLCWLLHMGAHCLADDGYGETALPPEAIEAAAEAPGGPQVIDRLSRALLEVAGLCLNEAARPVCSPRLMEAAVWAAARWADTYLFPEDALPATLEALFGASGSGPGVLEGLVRVATTCLVSYPGERELHAEVCNELLPVLVGRAAVCSRLLQLEPWQALVHAFASRDERLSRQLALKLHRSLARSLCAAAAGYGEDAASAGRYVEHVLGALAGAVEGLAAQPAAQLAATMQRADAQLEVCCLLESLRGAAQATLPITQPALYAIFCRLLQPLLLLHEACKQQSHVVAVLLKLADSIIETQVLEPHQMAVMFRWALALLTQYSKSNLWQVSLQTARSLQAERQSEQCRDLRALLKLLTHITQSNIVEAAVPSRVCDTAGPGPGSAATAAGAQPGTANGHQNGTAAVEGTLDVAQVVLMGLGIVIPLINQELLKFPKLSRLYYSLLAYILEAYPQYVVALPTQHFSTLMGTLDAGISGMHTNAAHLCLEGLAGLARWQQRQQQQQQRQQHAGNGGHVQVPTGLEAHTAGGRSVITHFQELLLRRLLVDNTPSDFVAMAADALLPMLLSEPGTYQRVAASLLAAHADEPHMAATISKSLSQLVSGEGLAALQGPDPMSRDALRRFRERLTKMVADVRGLVHMR